MGVPSFPRKRESTPLLPHPLLGRLVDIFLQLGSYQRKSPSSPQHSLPTPHGVAKGLRRNCPGHEHLRIWLRIEYIPPTMVLHAPNSFLNDCSELLVRCQLH